MQRDDPLVHQAASRPAAAVPDHAPSKVRSLRTAAPAKIAQRAEQGDMHPHRHGQRTGGRRTHGRVGAVARAAGVGLHLPAIDHLVVVVAVDQDVAGGLVSRPGLHAPVESAGSGERGKFVGILSDLLLLEAVLLGFRGSPVGSELVLDNGVGLRAVDAAGGGEQLRDALTHRARCRKPAFRRGGYQVSGRR
ncbi:hypothetical protein ACIRU5_34675 [Streptomyces misionensis]|uniref:hypothetical protein n=1 Tax=Streptomyces misionensis TaxID=67331 RepID=UPI003821524D